MIETTRGRRLRVDEAKVWAVLADFGAIARWAPGVDHSCLLSDRTEGVGTVRRIQIGRTTLVERAIQWEEPTTLGYSIEGLPPILHRVVNRWVVEPAGGWALVSLTSEIHPGPRPAHRLAARAAGKRLATAAEEMLVGLDRHLARREAA